jgi:hypothetical protein
MVATPAAVSADVVTDWNAIAVQATVTAGRPGPTGFLDIAMVQAAVYDAVQAIERRYEPYAVEIPGASGSSVAAAAKAAHDVLVNLFPAQSAQLDAAYLQSLSKYGLSEADPGIAVGAAAAAGIIALRAGDGSFPNPAPTPFTGGTEPGVWRPTPPNFQPMLAPWLGNVTPFALKEPSQFRAAPPPPLNSGRYAKEYNEVKALGARFGSTRTAEQTDIAFFWAGNPVVLWNRAIRDIAEEHVDDIVDSSRLFALFSLSVADALISAWNDKVHYSFWRPITAIREGDTDGNRRTEGDPNWESLITTPPYPDYPSGLANVASAVTQSLALFFGRDDIVFSVMTTNTGPTVQDTRTYESFSDLADEVVEARIYSGIHFRSADEAAQKQGRHVARWTFTHYFRSH